MAWSPFLFSINYFLVSCFVGGPFTPPTRTLQSTGPLYLHVFCSGFFFSSHDVYLVFFFCVLVRFGASRSSRNNRPDTPVSIPDVLKVMRDHYEGTKFDLTKGIAAGR